jgi:hypothetical protein
VIRVRARDRDAFVVVVYRDRIRELVPIAGAQHVGGQLVELIQRAAVADHAVLEIALALHPAVVAAVADDVDLFDVIHADVADVHRAVGRVPREPMRIAEAVRVDLAERLRIAVRLELVVGRDRVIAEPLRTTGFARAARIDAQDRRDHGIQPLRRARIVRVRAAAIAEAEVAAARVQQPVVRRARPRRGIELDVAERMARELHDVGDA